MRGLLFRRERRRLKWLQPATPLVNTLNARHSPARRADWGD
jgi:hypothetical protein